MTPEDDKYLEKWLEQRFESFKAELESKRRQREIKRMTEWTSRGVFAFFMFMAGIAFTMIVSTCQTHLK
jgi:hypothetical protein